MLVSKACLALNIDTCRKCIGGMPASGQVMTCPVDGAQVAVHATAGECPKGLLRKIPPLPLQTIPEGFSVEKEKRRMASGGCCGAPKQKPGE